MMPGTITHLILIYIVPTVLDAKHMVCENTVKYILGKIPRVTKRLLPGLSGSLFDPLEELNQNIAAPVVHLADIIEVPVSGHL